MIFEGFMRNDLRLIAYSSVVRSNFNRVWCKRLLGLVQKRQISGKMLENDKAIKIKAVKAIR